MAEKISEKTDDEEICLMERSKQRRLMSPTTDIWSPVKKKQTKKKNKNKNKEKKITESIYEEKGKKDLPVFELPSQIFFGDAVESEEEVLGDDERGEGYGGYAYFLNENKLTYTRVKVSKKIYFKHAPILYCEDYPVPTLAKFALDRCNSIEGTNYEYVGLVKAYAVPVGAFRYTVRFQARLPDQDLVYFRLLSLSHFQTVKMRFL
ncbi:hypothetical protein AgCh_037230 [Apium graveolens]